MSAWRRVEIVGRCNQTDVPSLELAIRPGQGPAQTHPLTTSMRLYSWAREQIHVTGWLAAEGFSVEDVKTTVLDLCRRCPTLEIAIHLGAEGGSDVCEATIVGIGQPNGEGPKVNVLPPRVPRVLIALYVPEAT